MSYSRNRLRVGLLLLACSASLGCDHRSAPLAANAHADSIIVRKHDHTLTLLQDGKALKVYRVALGRGGPGAKTHAGDNKVPEGQYSISGRNAHSAFHRALRISYPTPAQLRGAHAQGVDPGGDVMIHGIRKGFGWIGSLQRDAD